MTEADLLPYLARLVARGSLREAEARRIVAAFRAGDLPPDAFPALATSLVPLADDLAGRFASAALLAALYEATGRRPALARSVLGGLIRTATEEGARRAYAVIRSFPDAQRLRLATGILDAFDREARRRVAIIPKYDDGARSGIRRFHAAMRQAIRTDTLALAQLGNGGPLTPAQTARLAERLTRQDAYLQRFVDEVAARRALAEAGGRAAMSEAQIAARARTYAGSARAAYFDAVQGPYEGEAGVVVHFEGTDDPDTCGPCADAVAGSPYLPGQAPLPGAVCLGGGLCRHVLRFERDPDAYRSLTRRQAA